MDFEIQCNLDDMSIDPKDYEQYSIWIMNQKLGYATRKSLAEYASLKRNSMRYRLTGYITLAISLEIRMRRVYKSLPNKYQW